MAKQILLVLITLSLTLADQGQMINNELSSGYSPEKTGNAWQDQQATDKTKSLLQDVEQNQTPYGWYSAQMPELFLESMSSSMIGQGCPFSDDMPANSLVPFESHIRPKLIHSVGLVADCKFISSETHKYTGVFRGTEHLMVRLSSAKKATADPPFVGPGVGMKWMRDNIHSGNNVAMFSLEGQTSFNMFEHDYTNHVPNLDVDKIDVSLQLLLVKFKTASDWPNLVGLSDMAQYDQYGNNETTPNFPFRLILQPTEEAYNSHKNATFTDESYYVNQLNGTKVDKLWNVYAIDQPEDDLNPKPELIGEIVMTGSWTPSYYGDRNLFFQHQRIDDDIEIHPEWEAGINKINQQQSDDYPYTYPDLERPWLNHQKNF